MGGNILQHLLVIIIALCGWHNVLLAQSPFWQLLDGPYGGKIKSGVVTKDGALIISGSFEGVYRSVNSGESWSQISVSSSFSDYPLTMDPSSNRIFALIYESTNDGLEWHVLNDSLRKYIKSGHGVSSFLITPDGIMFAGGKIDIWGGFDQDFIYRSGDSGQTWQGVLESNTFDGLSIVGFGMTKSGVLFAYPDGRIQSPRRVLYRSTDNGFTWNYVDQMDSKKVLCVESGARDSDVFVGTSHEGQPPFISGLYYSSDNGVNWTLLLDKGAFDIHIQTGQTDTTIYAATGSGPFMSHDYGKSWSADTAGLSRTVNCFFEDQAGNLYAGTNGAGVYVKALGDSVWRQRTTGIRGMQPAGLLYHHQSGSVFSETWGSGLFRSTDHGASWQLAQNQSIWILGLDRDGTLYGLQWPEFRRSRDSGKSWEIMNRAFPTTEVAIDRDGWLYSNYDSLVWISVDSGRIWTSHNTGYGMLQGGAMAVDSKKHIYAATLYEIIRSTDQGNSWQKLGSPYGAGELLFDSRQILYAHDYFHVARTSDYGETWTQLTSPRPLAFRIDKDDNLFILTFEEKVFHSTDHGVSWQQDGDDVPAGAAGGFAIDSSGYIYVNSYFGEVYRSREPVLASAHEDVKQNLPTKFSLSQNYPNPFNPRTKFEVRIAKYEFVSLRVYNLLGEEVATPINELRQPGTYTVSWDAAKLPSGVYFYTMTAGVFRETKKLLLVR